MGWEVPAGRHAPCGINLSTLGVHRMIKLEDLQPNAAVRGILPDGIIDAIIKYYPEMAEDIIDWLKKHGFEHQGEIPRPQDSLEFKIVRAEQSVASIPGELPSIDDSILELFLLDRVGWSDGEFSPMELKYFYKCVPPAIFKESMEKWNQIEELWPTMSEDERVKYYEEVCQKARFKDEAWKAKIISNMIQMAK
jgi:hypothetical protein